MSRDLEICQVKAKCNFSPSEEQMAFINEWAKEKQLKFDPCFPKGMLEDLEDDEEFWD